MQIIQKYFEKRGPLSFATLTRMATLEGQGPWEAIHFCCGGGCRGDPALREGG